MVLSGKAIAEVVGALSSMLVGTTVGGAVKAVATIISNTKLGGAAMFGARQLVKGSVSAVLAINSAPLLLVIAVYTTIGVAVKWLKSR